MGLLVGGRFGLIAVVVDGSVLLGLFETVMFLCTGSQLYNVYRFRRRLPDLIMVVCWADIRDVFINLIPRVVFLALGE
jgi:hypothetical protein